MDHEHVGSGLLLFKYYYIPKSDPALYKPKVKKGEITGNLSYL
jgi:hypothetical protein